MQTQSEQINELAKALSQAQGERNIEKESKLAPQIENILAPIKPRNQHTKLPLLESFFEKIVYGLSECWYWRGSLEEFGYGRLQSKRAHRLSWTLFNGEIPKGLYVLHKCDIRNCVNPDHLFLGTQIDNMRDMVKKGRHNNGRQK